LITILVKPLGTVHLVDVTTLGRQAFEVTNSSGRSLRSVLESSDVIKVFFDIRNDSNAMCGLNGIKVQGIQDCSSLSLHLGLSASVW
jgi:exonuclease 3'-5' domain-containing protein 1